MPPNVEFLLDDAVRNPLAAWENFYIIVGSSAGALTGLQFVVIAYAALLAAAVLLPHYSGPALSLVAAAALGLVFIGIHNSWDTITYIAADRHQPDERERP